MSAGAPLLGVRVVVTRAGRQASGLAAALAAAGARVEALPLLEVVPPADPQPLARAAAELPLFDWVVFTSTNAVHALLPQAQTPGDGSGGGSMAGSAGSGGGRSGSSGAMGGHRSRPRIAAIGAATAAALRGLGIEPALVSAAREQSAGGLLAALLPHLDCGQRVLLPQAADALPTLRQGLLAAGIGAVAVVAYDKRLPEASRRRAAELFASQPIGWVTFTSPSIVRHFACLFGDDWPHRRVELRAASIGPVTTAELRRQGVDPAAEAAAPGDEELVAALTAAVTNG